MGTCPKDVCLENWPKKVITGFKVTGYLLSGRLSHSWLPSSAWALKAFHGVSLQGCSAFLCCHASSWAGSSASLLPGIPALLPHRGSQSLPLLAHSPIYVTNSKPSLSFPMLPFSFIVRNCDHPLGKFNNLSMVPTS